MASCYTLYVNFLANVTVVERAQVALNTIGPNETALKGSDFQEIAATLLQPEYQPVQHQKSAFSPHVSPMS